MLNYFLIMEIRKRVKSILKKHNICDTCLGRQFHNLYPKKTNMEIGRMLKSGFNYKKDEECYFCGGFFENFEDNLRKIEEELKKYEFRTFLVGSEFPKELINREEKLWEENGVDLCEAIKTNLNREVGIALKERIKKDVEFRSPDIMVIVDLENNKTVIQSSPLYIKGRYKKILPKEKVQKIIEKAFLEKSKSQAVTFYSIGRLEENVVTNFYKPFVVKLKSPMKRELNLKDLEKKINKNEFIKVKGLEYSDKEEITEIKKKYLISYSAVLEFDKLNDEETNKILENLKKVKGKKIHQELKNKIRRPKLNKLKANFDNHKLILELESTEIFSINDFLEKSKPNLKDTIGKKFRVMEIVMDDCKKLKK